LLNRIAENENFAQMMRKNIENIIIHFFEEGENFSVLCNIEDARFNPVLPQDIDDNFNDLTIFILAGYTFDSARIENNVLIFEAGFGSENFGSVVSIPLLSILQIIIDNTAVLVNIANYRSVETQIKEIKKNDKSDINGLENSMSSFLSNPENSKFLK
jgi:hypothetical protein